MSRLFVFTAMVLLAATGCEAVLAAELPEGQANEIIAALDQAGVGAKKAQSREGYEVRVASDDVGRAIGILEAGGLPEPDPPSLTEVFGGGSLVPTPTEEKARLVAALSGELAHTIERIDGVVDARVHIALPEERYVALDDAPAKPSASVLIKHIGDRAPYQQDDIAALLAGAVPELEPEGVSVVSLKTVRPASPTAERFVWIGPVAVSTGSALPVRAGLAVVFLVFIILSAALIALLVRSRRMAEQFRNRSPI